ncbi:MAG TPA: hypothetical protein VG756_22345 [Pseudonocardiaceae bacterium]|jgi:predicted glutamine amidotransferase|nr:hypothetical protein [Pseudonocardiaceae bacterium]
MCRLLGVISRVPVRLTGLLAAEGEHLDGWGVATWRAGELSVLRDVLAAQASVGGAGLVTDAALLQRRDTPPFRAGAIAFAHHGFFAPATAVDELIDADLLADLLGDNDSERYFRCVLSRMRHADPIAAIARAAADIRARAEPGGLDCLLLTQDALYAYADAETETEGLRYRVAEGRVVVASGGISGRADWRVLPAREVLEIRRADLRVSRHQLA